MKKSSLLFLALAGSLFIYSCEKKSENQQTGQQDTASTAKKEEVPQDLTEDDKNFITKAAEDGMLEVQLGQLASEKGVSKEVKSFGQLLVTQHQAANDELKQLASADNVTIPDSLSDDAKSKVNKFKEKETKDFDKDFIKEVVDEHKKDINEFEQTGQKTQDPELKAWIDKTLPHLKHHLMEAEKIDSTMNAKSTKKSMIKK